MTRRPTFRFNPLWWITADTRSAEAYSALMFLVFGVGFLVHGSLFDRYAVYRSLGAIMPEQGWGCLFLAQWAMQSLAMCGNVWMLRYPSALLAFVLWSGLGCLFLIGAPTSLSPYPSLLLALFMAWVVWKGPTDGST